MMEQVGKSEITRQLQKDILLLQGFRAPSDGLKKRFDLGQMENAFPNQTFTTGSIHEFVSAGYENAAATSGFMAGLLGKLMEQKGSCLWISANRTLFPPALKFFGVEPDRVIFIDLKKEKDLLWAIEESLKCDKLAAVVGEIREMTLTESRRLQLAVEQSRVTGLLHRHNPRTISALACVSRWKITPVPSKLEPGMPGVGYPRWNVELLKVRNGEPGSWQVEWSDNWFQYMDYQFDRVQNKDLLKTG
jgi:protein ImuA